MGFDRCPAAQSDKKMIATYLIRPWPRNGKERAAWL
jgi:hypothetical protein